MSECECPHCHKIKSITAERDAAIARADALSRMLDGAIARAEALDENLATAIESLRAAERARDELGIQLAAQSERLRLAMAVVEAARGARLAGDVSGDLAIRHALAALDAVPGDALAKVGG